MHGLLLIDKPPGCTSHDVVQRVRRILRQKKIGHCGTLDPEATGLLLLTLGSATRLTRFLIRAPKVYEGTVRFGIATDTYDATGTVTSESSTAGLTAERAAEGMRRFEGVFEQQPPPYSAKKVKGVKFYELARRGEEVPQETKEVTVYELSPVGELADDRLDFRLACSSGTYARTLAHDLGAALGCGAHLARLRRTRIGPFEVAGAIGADELERRVAAAAGMADAGQPAAMQDGDGQAATVLTGAGQATPSPPSPEVAGEAWIPFDRIPLPFGEITADPQQEQRISHGQTVLVRQLEGEEGDWIKMVNQRRELIAVGTVVERIGSGGVGIVQPRVVFR